MIINNNYSFEYSKWKSSRQPAQKIAELLFADVIASISSDIKEMKNMLDNVIDCANN